MGYVHEATLVIRYGAPIWPQLSFGEYTLLRRNSM